MDHYTFTLHLSPKEVGRGSLSLSLEKKKTRADRTPVDHIAYSYHTATTRRSSRGKGIREHWAVESQQKGIFFTLPTEQWGRDANKMELAIKLNEEGKTNSHKASRDSIIIVDASAFTRMGLFLPLGCEMWPNAVALNKG